MHYFQERKTIGSKENKIFLKKKVSFNLAHGIKYLTYILYLEGFLPCGWYWQFKGFYPASILCNTKKNHQPCVLLFLSPPTPIYLLFIYISSFHIVIQILSCQNLCLRTWKNYSLENTYHWDEEWCTGFTQWRDVI